MKKPPQQSVTSLPPSPDQERRGRMLKYSIAMGIRLVCVVLLFVIPYWWRWFFAVGALALPYIAVVIANTASSNGTAVVARPGAVVPYVAPRGDDE
jgi:predicted tellurium resistance membrane protein TerC